MSISCGVPALSTASLTLFVLAASCVPWIKGSEIGLSGFTRRAITLVWGTNWRNQFDFRAVIVSVDSTNEK